MKNIITALAKLTCYTLACMIGVSSVANEKGYSWDLVNNGKLVVSSTEDQFDKDLDISFPSIIKVPSWARIKAHPEAKYYLYYAEHHGDAISMKWAKKITGPWYSHDTPGKGGNGAKLKGVMDFQADSYRYAKYRSNKQGHTFGSNKKLDGGWMEDWRKGHVAAPDVYVDEKNKIFIMAWHGKTGLDRIMLDDGNQLKFYHTGFVAFSRDGLNFNDPETGGGQTGQWGPNKLPFGPLEQSAMYKGKKIYITQPIMASYSRLFKVRDRFYAIGSEGALHTPIDPAHPWLKPKDISPKLQFNTWWKKQDTPNSTWKKDPKCLIQQKKFKRRYLSFVDTFFRSTLFENHPKNPYPGYPILAKSKVNHPEIAKLSDDRLEYYAYIRGDKKGNPPEAYPEDDPFRQVIRVELDVSNPDWNKWDIARHSVTGKPILDVVITPEELDNAVMKANRGQVNGKTHADPDSMGACGVLLTDAGKYCFVGFKSKTLNPDFAHSEGQITCIKLTPK